MEGSWTVERARALTRRKLSESSLSPTSSLWLWPGVSFVVQPSQLEGCLTFFFFFGGGASFWPAKHHGIFPSPQHLKELCVCWWG